MVMISKAVLPRILVILSSVYQGFVGKEFIIVNPCWGRKPIASPKSLKLHSLIHNS